MPTPPRRLVFFLIAIGAVAALLYLIDRTGFYWLGSGKIQIFEGVVGPERPTRLSAPEPARWQDYAGGGAHRLAVLLTDPDSPWLSLAFGLKTAGIPFAMTRDTEEALRHDVVLIYPRVSGKLLAPDALRALAAHVRDGGTLIGINVLGGLNSVFGFAQAEATRAHHRVQLQTGHPLLTRFEFDEERTLAISNPAHPELSLGSHHYLQPRNPPLAVYEDGQAAIVWRRYGRGQAYALGFDPGLLLFRGYNYRGEPFARQYANGYEPTLDVLLLLLRDIYVSGEPEALWLDTVPQGKELSVIMTHDVDYNRSLENAVAYAELERGHQAPGTYFIQTKYIRDWNDEIFFDEQGVANLQRLVALGMEVGSHSVSHSQSFAGFPLGDGEERYPDYRPFVKAKYQTLEGTILGELRVSRFLLRHFAGAQAPVTSFRPGHLANPRALPQALQATGYRYASLVSANTSLTHWPFRLSHNREGHAALDVFDFPVTVEDELPPRMGDRLPQAIALAERLRRYGGCFVVLIHPDVLDHKLAFAQGFLEAVEPYAWRGSLAAFGSWWAARDAIELDVQTDGTSRMLVIEAPLALEGLSVRLPARWRLRDALLPGVQQTGDRLLIDRVEGSLRIEFELEDA